MLYVVCGIRRTGTTVLMEMLRDSGWGFADEYLNSVYALPDSPLDFVQWVSDQQPSSDITGVKVTWGDLDRLGAQWKMSAETALSELIDGFHDEAIRFLYLTRRDHRQQAQSVRRAMQTNVWHLRPGETFPPQPHIRDSRLAGEISWVEECERRWEAWFRTNGLSPMRLVYEDWQHDPAGAWLKIANRFGMDVTRDDAPPVPLVKIARPEK